MNSSILRSKIQQIDEQLKPLMQEKSRLNSELGKLESEEFIAINGITKEQVEDSDGEGVPWLGTFIKFGEWLHEHSDKPWCAWNGYLYQSSEIINGRMSRDPVGRYEDLQA